MTSLVSIGNDAEGAVLASIEGRVMGIDAAGNIVLNSELTSLTKPSRGVPGVIGVGVPFNCAISNTAGASSNLSNVSFQVQDVFGNAIAAVLMRHTRSAMLQVLNTDYVRTARAKGLSERRVVLKHALRNALTPIITLGALEFGTLLSGAVLTEQVFSIPGFGKLIVDAVFNRDYAVVQGVVLFTSSVYIALNLLADLAYFYVNPRMRG